jgi:hypothetical protein
MVGGPAQAGEMKNINPKAQNMVNDSMDKFLFPLLIGAAIVAPFPKANGTSL